jgi:hypothetical protein
MVTSLISIFQALKYIWSILCYPLFFLLVWVYNVGSGNI